MLWISFVIANVDYVAGYHEGSVVPYIFVTVAPPASGVNVNSIPTMVV